MKVAQSTYERKVTTVKRNLSALALPPNTLSGAWLISSDRIPADSTSRNNASERRGARGFEVHVGIANIFGSLFKPLSDYQMFPTKSAFSERSSRTWSFVRGRSKSSARSLISRSIVSLSFQHFLKWITWVKEEGVNPMIVYRQKHLFPKDSFLEVLVGRALSISISRSMKINRNDSKSSNECPILSKSSHYITSIPIP